MNVLVTGGAGYIGSHFAKAVSQAGDHPVVIDNLSTGHRKFVKYGPFIQADLRESAAVADVLRDHSIDVVVHFAARSIVSESMKQPDFYRDNNVGGTRALLEAMSKANVRRLVFSSSCGVYGNSGNTPLPESHATQPNHPYGETKLECERLVREFVTADSSRTVTCLRYFNVVGQDPEGDLWEDHQPETHLVPNVLRSLRDGSEFSLHASAQPTADGTCVRDFVDVNDLAQVHMVALRRLKPGIMISNVGKGCGHSVREVIEIAERISGRKIQFTIKPPRAGDPPFLVADGRFFRSWCDIALRPLEESMSLMWSQRSHVRSAIGG